MLPWEGTSTVVKIKIWVKLEHIYLKDKWASLFLNGFNIDLVLWGNCKPLCAALGCRYPGALQFPGQARSYGLEIHYINIVNIVRTGGNFFYFIFNVEM